MASTAVKDFEPFVGAGGGQKRILATKENVSQLDFGKHLRPTAYYAKAGNTGKKGVSVKPMCVRPGHDGPEAPKYILGVEVKDVRMTSQDAGRSAGSKELSGKVSWGMTVDEEQGKALQEMGMAAAKALCSARPGKYYEWETKAGKLVEVATEVDNVALWWSSKDPLHKGMYKETQTELGLGAESSKWSDEEHKNFQEAFFVRVTEKPRDPDVPFAPEGSKEYEDYKVAQKPTFKPAVTVREDGTMVAYVTAKNFKKGAPETRTGKDGKEAPREQTYFCEVGEGGKRKRLDDPVAAVQSLQHHSGGAEGFRSSRPFTILVHRGIIYVDHWWIGNTGINPTVNLDFCEYSVIQEDTSFYDQLAGITAPPAKVAKKEEEKAADAAEEQAEEKAADENKPEGNDEEEEEE